MRVSLPRRRPPTMLERVLGRRRARSVRHRAGLAALATGYSLLKPRPRWLPLGWTVITLATLAGVGVTIR